MSERIRQSEFTKFTRCRRSHHFAYTLNQRAQAVGPRMPASSHRDAGSAVHKGIEVLHQGGEIAAARAAVKEYVDTLRAIRWEGPLPELSKHDTKEWWECERIAQAMLGHYLEWIEEGSDAGYVTKAVEHNFEVELMSGVSIFGQIDLVGYDPLLGGDTVEDLKSVADFSKPPLPVNFQLRTYAWAWWRTTGEIPVQGAHRSIKRVLGTGNAKRPFVVRSPIHLDEMILLKHEEALKVRAEEILKARGLHASHPFLYTTDTKDCHWDCDFKSICPMVDEEDDWEGVLESQFRLADRTDNL